jgi:hypothetical protein
LISGELIDLVQTGRFIDDPSSILARAGINFHRLDRKLTGFSSAPQMHPENPHSV